MTEITATIEDAQPITVTFEGGAGSGTSDFIALTDTPSTYTGQAGKFPQVNSGETALEFSAAVGITTFLGLTDTPSTYSGQAGKVATVNSGETALEFSSAGSSSPLTTKGDVYTYTTVDARLAVGTDGQALLAASGETTGLLWTSLAASNISDFDTEVSNNSSVTTNSSFTATPSTVITAGTGLSWTGNTINSVWTVDTNGITYGGNVGINGASDATAELYVNGGMLQAIGDQHHWGTVSSSGHRVGGNASDNLELACKTGTAVYITAGSSAVATFTASQVAFIPIGSFLQGLGLQGGDFTISSGVAYVKEQASASSDIPGHGQLWVKTATPNQLWFTDDGGNDFQLGAGEPNPLTTKGDIFTYTTVDARLGVGANGEVLGANSATATGLEWVTAGTGNVSNTGTPVNNQIAVWTNATTIEGSTNLYYDTINFLMAGDFGATASRITKGWFTDITVTNPIAGSITGNAGTVTTIDGVTMTLGSDAEGDVYYRNGSGILTRLGIGTNGQSLTVNAGATAPEWTTPAGGGDMLIATYDASGVSEQLAGLTAVQALTNKTITDSTNVLGGVTMTLGSDADGDTYYRSSNVLTRLAKGTAGQVLTMNAGATAPEWAAGGGGSGDVTKVGTPVDNQVGVWTGNGTIEGTTGLTYDGSNFQLTGDIGSTGTRITKGWFTDLTVTNAITGSITGNAGTVTTITGLAPDTQNTYARTQYLIPYASSTTAFGEIAIGTAAQVLTSNGAGAAPSFQASTATGGATTALDNLASVAINTSLISDTDETDDLGTDAKKWDNIYAKSRVLDSTPSANLNWSGDVASFTATSSFTIGQVGYLDSAGGITLCDADAVATSKGMLVMATNSITATNAGVFLLRGFLRYDTWAWTVGAELFLSTTAGGTTETAPSASADIVRIIGHAVSADIAYFNPSQTYQEIA